DAVLATDERVVSGSDYYHRAEQKVGLIYKTDAITVTGARLIALAAQSSFGGRPPLEVELTARVAGTEVAMVVIVFHGKAGTGSSDLSRRLAGSNALKSYLDATHPDSHVLLLGDFNDDVDTSIRNGRDSPYKNFVDDSERYWVPTEILSELGVSSTVRHDQMLDHQLVSDELAVYYIAESAAVVELDQYISRYDDTTSNHYPVVASYRWAEELGGPVFMNELLANEPGGSTGHEFIELVNSGDVAIDLSRWTLSDSVRVRHVFADDTVIEPGAALVVFADAAAIPAELENAVAASEGSLSLNNGGDLVRLRDSAEQVVAELEYARDLAGRDGVSMNRDPDGDGTGAFALHDAAGAASSSPGLRRDGRSW
ncbi:MAG: lamin tail domain-containing protein, partial [Myxococcota bacterium]